MRSHDTVSKFAYISIFTLVSKCVHVNGALLVYILLLIGQCLLVRIGILVKIGKADESMLERLLLLHV